MSNPNFDSYGTQNIVVAPRQPWQIKLTWKASQGKWDYVVFGDEEHPQLGRSGYLTNPTGAITNSHVLTITGADQMNFFRLSSNFIRINGQYQMFHVTKRSKNRGQAPYRYTPRDWDAVKKEIAADGITASFTRVIAGYLQTAIAHPWNAKEEKNEKKRKVTNLNMICIMQLRGWAWSKGFEVSVAASKNPNITHPNLVHGLFTQDEMKQEKVKRSGQLVDSYYPLFEFVSLNDLLKSNKVSQEVAVEIYNRGKNTFKQINAFLDQSEEFFMNLGDKEADDGDGDDVEGYTLPETEETDIPEFAQTKEEKKKKKKDKKAKKTKTEKTLEAIAKQKADRMEASSEVSTIVEEDDSEPADVDDDGGLADRFGDIPF